MMPRTPKAFHVALITTIEPIGRRRIGNVEMPHFGMTLSVAVGGDLGSAAAEKQCVELLRPWLWTVPRIRVFVPKSDLHPSARWIDSAMRTGKSDDADRARALKQHVITRLDEQWSNGAKVPSRFRWNAQPYATVDAANQPWFGVLANVASQPYPLPQQLQLSFTFAIPAGHYDDQGYVAAFPEIRYKDSATAVQYVATEANINDPKVRDQLETGWGFRRIGSQGAPPRLRGYAQAVRVLPETDRDTEGFGLNPSTLWIESTEKAYDVDWRASLKRYAAEAFDLPQRMIDAARVVNAAGDESCVPTLGKGVTCESVIRNALSAADPAQTGKADDRILPSGLALVEWLSDIAPGVDPRPRLALYTAARRARPTLAANVGSFRDMVLAACRDGADFGQRRGPQADNLVTEWWRRVEIGANGVTDVVLSDAKPLLRKMEAIQGPLMMPEWEMRLMDVPRLATVLGNANGATSLTSTIDTLQSLHNLLRDDEIVTELVLAQWRALDPTNPDEPTLKRLAELVRAAEPRLHTARRLLDLGVIGSPASLVRPEISHGGRALPLPAATPSFWRTLTAIARPPRTVADQAKAASAQREEMRRRFHLTLVAYLFRRFGASGAPRGAPDVDAIVATFSPESGVPAATARTILQALSPLISTWAHRIAAVAIPEPTDGEAGAAAQGSRESVPHGLTIQVAALSQAPDEGAEEKRPDAMRRVGGFGVLLRRSGTNDKWRTPNACAYGEVVSRGRDKKLNGKVTNAGDPALRHQADPTWWCCLPVITPARVRYEDGLRQPLITYDNRPLVAVGPEALLGNHGLVAGADDTKLNRPVAQFLFLPSDANSKCADLTGSAIVSEWGKLPALIFGRKYDVLRFAVSASGALPVGLADPDHPARLVDTPPSTLPDAPPPMVLTYLRRVAVGLPRVSSTSYTMKGVKTNAYPPIPDRVFPRLYEVQPLEKEMPDHPLVLLAPEQTSSSNPCEFEMKIMKPATDLQTWHRWIADTLAADKQQAVVAEYYRRMRDNHKNRDAQSAFVEPLLLDDPAVKGLVVEVFHYATDGKPETSESWYYALLTKTNDYTAADIPNASSWPLIVRFKVRPSSASADASSPTLDINMGPGDLKRMRVMSVMATDDVQRRFAKGAVEVFTPSSFTNMRNGAFPPDCVGVNPMTVWSEAADLDTFKVVERTRSDTVAVEPQIQLWSLLSPSYVTAEIPGNVPGALPTPSARLSIQATVPVAKFPNVHHARLRRQTWRWEGRPVEQLPTTWPNAQAGQRKPLPNGTGATQWWEQLSQGDATGWNEIVERWEGREFGGRPAGDHFEVVMNDVVQAGDTGPEHRWSHELMNGGRAARYHRFALVVENRYQGALDTDYSKLASPMLQREVTETGITREWHSFFEPCRPIEPLKKPAIRALLPLTESARSGSRGSRQPGLLVVMDDVAFDAGGLAEDIAVRISRAALDPKDRPGNINSTDPIEELDEIGTDPLVSAEIIKVEGSAPDENGWWAPTTLEKEGPVGHSHDVVGRDRLFVASSYRILPPKVAKGNDHEVSDIPWHFVKLAFGRRLRPELCIGARPAHDTRISTDWREGGVTEWTDGEWAQFLPAFDFETQSESYAGVEFAPNGKDTAVLLRGNEAAIVHAPDELLQSTGVGSVQEVAVLSPMFEPILVLTRPIFDVAERSAEAYVGVMRRRKCRPSEWELLPEDDRGGTTPDLTTGRYIARVVELQLGSRSAREHFWDGCSSTIGKPCARRLWQRLFAPPPSISGTGDDPRRLISDGERARMVRISPAIPQAGRTAPVRVLTPCTVDAT